MVLLSLSCKTPPAAGPEPESVSDSEKEEEFTQDHANNAFEQVYETHQFIIILEGARNYRVMKNDTASRIATRFYGRGNGYFFPLIILASRNVILDPDLIEPGMNLIIPDLQKNLDNDDTRKGIKAFLFDMADVYENKTSRWASVTQRELIKLAKSL
jgi:hypothetical protein